MNPTSLQSKANDLWLRFRGMFGADAIERKFGPTPPDEWKSLIGSLNDFELERGMRRLVYSGKAHVPTLPEFGKMCRAIGDEIDLNMPRPIALPAPPSGKFDGWDISGNMRFWKYISHRLSSSPRAWGIPGSTQQAEATKIAVSYKNAWAQDMREGGALDESTGELAQPQIEAQNLSWADCMRRAESEIDNFLEFGHARVA